jgi:tRNA threonylcarbamoyl adenosine modification protein YeaZ
MLLAIETSSLVCGASLHAAGECIAESYLEQPRVHAEKLAVLVRDLFEEQSLGIEKLDAVAVSAGPGSFTGLRIGMSFAKGLVYPHRIPLAGVNTMKAFMEGNRGDADPAKHPVAVIHSHGDHIYTAAFAGVAGETGIRYGRVKDIPAGYPDCRQIIANADIGVRDRELLQRPVLPSVIGEYYLRNLDGSAVRDYDRLVLEYGMKYKPKEWSGPEREDV